MTGQALTLHFDPKLVEEAVFFAQRDRYIAKELEERRSRIYEVGDADERERLFHKLYLQWFGRLGLGDIVDQALREQPLIQSSVADGYVVCATQAKHEGAELFVSTEPSQKSPRRTLRILLRPESMLAAEPTRTFLRHELFHIFDMLDPTFAYEPSLPESEGGPTYDTLITNRYRTLWDLTIDSRMVQRGWLPESVRDHQLKELRQAFPMLNESAAGACFSRFFDTARPKHADLAAFALDPRSNVESSHTQAAGYTHCPLCKFPTQSFEAQPENLGPHTLQRIAADFPNWDISQGLCLQCAELYRARHLSLAALQALPGGNHAQLR